MSWASQRKLTYATGIFVFVFIVASIPAYLYLNKEPTCFDGKKNGGEKEVDRGGPCEALSSSDLSSIIIHWARPFRTSSERYDVVASVENQNKKAGVRSVIYKFKLYDENNILIMEKLGKTFVGPSENFIIFEGGVRTGERIPKRVFFEFEPDINWERVELPKNRKPKISIKDRQLTNIDTRPKLKAILSNDAPIQLNDISVVVVLYDINDNAIAVSSTRIDGIEKNSEKQVVFTWGEPFPVQPIRIDIIPRVNVFTLKDRL